MTVLIVEDDPAIRRLVGDQLVNRGLLVSSAATVAEAREALRQQSFDTLILDISLPDGSGIDVLRELRQRGCKSHVIVLSGAATEIDRVGAIELGADDYVVKPFFARELAARVVAVRRRRDPEKDFRLQVGHLEIDLAARTVIGSGTPLELTAKEFDLLAFLAARPGHVFSRDDLLRAVWRSASDWQQATTVTEHVRRLRTKIELDPQQPQLLCTVRGAGYRFDLPADDTAPVTAEPSGGSPAATIVHVGGRIVIADQAATELLGFESGGLVGKRIVDLPAPASLAATQERLRDVAAGRTPRSQLFTLLHRDGSEVPVEVTSRATIWNDQPASQVDVTAVTDPSTRLRHLITGVITDVSDAVIITDLHFHIRSWNRAAERLYGWAEQEVLGRHILDIVEWAQDEEVTGVAERLEATGRWHGERRHRSRDGAELRIQASTTVVRDHGGEPVGIVSINRPVASRCKPVAERPSTSDEADIRRGIAAGEFKVHYQPLVRLDDEQVLGVEALIRWNHPERGLLGPDQFLDTAEHSGSILDLGSFVLDAACRQGDEWRRAGVEMDVGVNLSSKELSDPGLVDRVVATLASTGMDPHHLWLEVTETALVEDVEEASAALHQLAELGIRISIDDFGTGWASLTYLKQFPVHALKIDRSFVEGIDHNANDAAIARSILSLGAELGLAVVAEGIETPAQQHALQELGCTIGQGFLYGRPTPAGAVPVDRAAVIGTAPPSSSLEVATPGPLLEAGAAGVPEAPRLSDIVTTTLRALLRIRSPQVAAELLQRAARTLGADLLPAAEAGADALQIDLALGEGPPLLAVVERMSPARMELERILPRLAEDARHAIDLLRQTERLEEDSNHDPLTGLANRRVLERVLARALDGAVVMIDLDHFKVVNDTLGHAAGDAVLARFGRTLRREVRAVDTSCRLGGEEFVVVVAGLDEPLAADLVDRIREAWACDAPHPVTFSAGVASVTASGGTSALLAADRALYRAKTCGRNRTEIESSDPRFEVMR